MSKFGLKIPSVWWLLIGKAMQIGCIVFTAYAVFYAIPANNRSVDNLVRPTPNCFYEYAQSNDPVRTGGQQTVTENCKNQVDEYFKTDSTITLLEIIFGLYVVSFVVLWLTLKKWYVPFAEAIATATKHKLNSTNAMLLLVVAPSPFGMLAIQDAYNKS